MSRKLLLAFLLPWLAAPGPAQPIAETLSWPARLVWIERLSKSLEVAIADDDSGGSGSDREHRRARATGTTRRHGLDSRIGAVSITHPGDSAGGADAQQTSLDRIELLDALNDETTTSPATLSPPEDISIVEPVSLALLSSDGFDAESFAACATGTVRGFALDAATGKYNATCGNYNWSAESGSATAYNTATTPGGNGEYITCTAVGVATSDLGGTYDDATLVSSICAAGSNTAVCKLASTSIAANTYRDRLIRVEIDGTVNYRRISSDVDNGADHDFSLTPDKPFSGSPAGEAFVVQDDIGVICANPGERIKLNYMADAMLAQDHTVPGGKVYFPNFAGYDHAIYVQRGCGRKGTVAFGTSSNQCPVLAPPLNEHYQRSLQAFRRINWVSQGVDPDGWENGRKNVWHVDDLGGSRPTNHGFDPNDGTTPNPNWTFKSGLASTQARSCTPMSTTDPTCDPLGSSISESGDSSWGRVFQWVNTSQTTDSTALCVSTSLPDSGTCRGDRRIPCTSTGARTSKTAGGCDFGSGGDLGPCESARDAIEYEVETQGKELKILAHWNLYEFPETTVQQGTETADFFTVNDVPGSSGSPVACGTGAAISTVGPGDVGGSWPFGKSKLEPTDTFKEFVVLDWERWYNAGGGWTQGTFTPNQWYGRDIDDSGTSGLGDCLSGGTTNASDDETFCDYNALMGLHSSYSGGFHRTVVANGSSSTFDGSVSGIKVELYDSLIINGKRGSLGDVSNWDFRNNSWINNHCSSTCLPVNFTHSSTLRDQWFVGNSGGTILGTNHGKGSLLDGLFFQGNSGNQIAITHASDLRISNVNAYGNRGPFLVIAPQFPLNNFTLTHVNVYSQGQVGNGTVLGDSLVTFGRLGSTTLFNQTIRNFTFSDVHWETPQSDTCLFYFDDAQGADDATINVNRTQFSISDVSIDGLNGATGQKAICVAPIGNLGGGGVTNGIDSPGAGDDLGIALQRYQPTWRNARANGVPMPDQPIPMMAAASAGDCNALTHGTLVRIHDDTGIGACTDAGTNGTLDGGGTAVSTCGCDGAGAWTPVGTTGDVVSTGASVSGAIPIFTDTGGNEVVDSGATIVDGVLTLAPSTVRPSEIRYLEDTDLGSNYIATQAVSAGTNLTGNAKLILASVSRALAAASGARGPVVGAVSNGGTFDTPERLCDLAYYAANGVIQSCIAGTAKEFDPATAAPSWIGCAETVASGTYFEVVCNVE